MTEYTISRSDGAADVFALQDALNVLKESAFWDSPTAKRLLDLRRSIEEQMKPAIEEPQAFGSIIRARDTRDGKPEKSGLFWVRQRAGWFDDVLGRQCPWEYLEVAEVLRVGIGDEYRQQVRDLLFISPSGTLTHEEVGAAYKELRKGLSGLLEKP